MYQGYNLTGVLFINSLIQNKMEVQIELKDKHNLVKESDNLVDALSEFDAKEIESVVYTEGNITTFAKPVKEFRGYTLKTTGKYNNRTGEFEK